MHLKKKRLKKIHSKVYNKNKDFKNYFRIFPLTFIKYFRQIHQGARNMSISKPKKMLWASTWFSIILCTKFIFSLNYALLPIQSSIRGKKSIC